MGVDLQKILSGEDLAAGEEKPQAAGVGQLIDHAAVFPGAELARVLGFEGQVGVAVGAAQVAAPGDLDGPVEGVRRATPSRWSFKLHAS